MKKKKDLIPKVKKHLGEKGRKIAHFATVIALVMCLEALMLLFIAHAPWYVIVDELIGQALYSCFVLLVYGYLETREMMPEHHTTKTLKILYAGWLGALILAFSGYWTTSKFWCVMDGALALLLGVLGLVWYFKVIGHETELADAAEQKLWKEKKDKWEKEGWTEEEIYKDAATFLEHYTVGDLMEGDVDVDRPLCAEGLTLAEMASRDGADVDVEYQNARSWLTRAIQIWKQGQKEGK